MDRDKLTALKHVAQEKIFTILDKLQIEYEERYKYVYSTCPIHKGDRPNGWSWHLDLGIWGCWTKGCHQQFNKDIFGLIMGVNNCTFPMAVKFVENVLDGTEVDVSEVMQLRENKLFVNRTKKKQQKVFPDAVLDKLIYHEYLESRGYPKELIESYQIGISSSKYKAMSNRIIVPVRNLDGELVGFTGRTLYKDWENRGVGKWRHSEDFVSSDNLFNIDRAAKHIQESGQVILVEGPLDVLRLEQAGIHNSLAIFGRKLHPGQITLLIKVGGVNKIIFAFDSDVPGRTGMEDGMKMARSYFSVDQVNLEDGDVGDLSVLEAKEIFA